MRLTKSQKKAVNRLFEAYLNRDKEKVVCFKAPTGSGKTLMASEFIAYILGKAASIKQKIIVVFMTLSSAELPRQLEIKLLKYRKFHKFKNYNIEFIDSPSKQKERGEEIKGFNLEDNESKVFVLGVSSFGKNTLFYQNRVLDTFIQQINALDYKLIFIRDEAHIGVGQLKINKNVLSQVNEKLFDAAEFIIAMTATPPTGVKTIVEITEEELENDDLKLLKYEDALKNLVHEIGKENVEEEELIDFAIQKFKETQKKYDSLDIEKPIRPALLIQVDNDSLENIEIKRKFQNSLKSIEKKLKKYDLTYLIYFGNEKEVRNSPFPDLSPTLEYASRNESWIDAIIFKVGPTVGWDIPRANTLLQLRGVQSPALNWQTLGRIKRNPYPGLKYNEVTNKYYVYYNSWPAKKGTEYFLQPYKLKNEFIEKTLKKGRIINDPDEKVIIITEYKNMVRDFIHREFQEKLNDDLDTKVVFYEDWCNENIRVRDYIENEIYVKIHNKLNFDSPDSEKLLLKDFFRDLRRIKTTKSFEVTKYYFYSYKNTFKKYMNKAKSGEFGEDIYQISDSKNLPSSYVVSVPNKKNKKRPIKSIVENIQNYGYYADGQDYNYQYLDSRPEKEFLDNFRDRILKKFKINVDFLVKMPKFSDVYFEYRSKENENEIRKSYMDFAIEYKNRIVMIEVKSKEWDYNESKTNDLKQAYQKYMLSLKNQIQNEKNKRLYFVVYWYDEDPDLHEFHYLLSDGQWKESTSFTAVFQMLFDLGEEI